jgi:hypothetical protein
MLSMNLNCFKVPDYERQQGRRGHPVQQEQQAPLERLEQSLLEEGQ